MLHKKQISAILFILMATIATTTEAHAYLGPGGGVSAIGALVALISAIVIAILGFFWYPVKRLIRHFKKSSNTSNMSSSNVVEK